MTTSEPHADLVARYRHFAEHEAAGSSPTFVAWAATVASSPEICDLLVPLSRREQQPNLVFAAARRLGAVPGDPDSLRATLTSRWVQAREILRTRRTQTNEAARCALLLPLLARIAEQDGPLALLEVGASAGLCLQPDRYSYRYRYADGTTRRLDPVADRSTVLIDCELSGDVPLPTRMPEIVWRAGLDLDPLDPADPDIADWLETLVWPEHEDRRARLRAAIGVARRGPAPIHRGDLLTDLRTVADQAPSDATLVVFHSQVLVYVHDAAERRRFAEDVAALPGHWISNEGTGVLDVPLPPGVETPAPGTATTIALDGRAVALGHGHGRSLRWLEVGVF